MRNISPPPGFDPRTTQTIASRYTDWAIPAHMGGCRTEEIISVPLGQRNVVPYIVYFKPLWGNKIQGVSQLEEITAGDDFLGLCDQVHINMCPILDGYEVTGIFLIPVHAFVWTASHGTSWRVMYSNWWLIFCVASIIIATWLAQFATERQPVLRTAVAFSKTSFKYRSIQIKCNFTKLTLHLYFNL